MIRTEFSYSKEEIRDFYKFHITTKGNARLIYNLMALLFAVLGIGVLLIFKDRLFSLLLLATSVVVLIIYPVQLNKTINKIVYSTYSRDKQQIDFYEEYIETKIESESKKYTWDQITEVNETSKYFYFYLGKNNALIVNKNNLNELSKNELVKLIKCKKGNIILYLKK